MQGSLGMLGLGKQTIINSGANWQMSEKEIQNFMQRFVWLLPRRTLATFAPTAPRLSIRPPSLHPRFRARTYGHGPDESPFVSSQLHKSSKTHFPQITPDGVIPYFKANVETWAKQHTTYTRIVNFGVSAVDARRLLQQFVDDVKADRLSDPELVAFYQLNRFAKPHEETSIDIIYSTTFFSWVRKTSDERLAAGISPSCITHLTELVTAASRRFPEDEHAIARTLHRKIIMHVGPTNSGKTHHALRALAASPSGVYSGPLRLLAHEIWERLNTGQIVPLDQEQPPPHLIPKYGHPKYATPCNMVTGEEAKIVSSSARHLSCTVEMIPLAQRFKLAVVDEIQMISDPNRGQAWTHAVLGLAAEEIHLCGEETAVPVVQELLKNTGDSLEVRRYERLTPLVVESESLGGDLTKIRKGDCVVAFSRSGIFRLKKSIEAKTGMRCAVVYGRLPPEVRSEQAALFNDPDSGYDVLIGSDAIGMGLNLKIKRIIFESVVKYEGHAEKLLSVSSVKQIAGRAGRFGLHTPSPPPPSPGSEAQSASTAPPPSSSTSPASSTSISTASDLGGTVTTLWPKGLPYLKYCIDQPPTPLPFARIGPNRDTFSKITTILSPTTTSMRTLLEAQVYVGELSGDWMRGTSVVGLEAVCQYLDMMDLAEMSREQRRKRGPKRGQEKQEREKVDDALYPLSLEQKVTLLNAPIPWRDDETVELIKRMLIEDRQKGRVWYDDLQESWEPYMTIVGDVEGAMLIEEQIKEMKKQQKASKEGQEKAMSTLQEEGQVVAKEGQEEATADVDAPSSTLKVPEVAFLPDTLGALETFHKALVFYMWMSFRNPVVYASHVDVSQLKERTELCLNYCLQKAGTEGELMKKRAGKGRRHELESKQGMAVDGGREAKTDSIRRQTSRAPWKGREDSEDADLDALLSRDLKGAREGGKKNRSTFYSGRNFRVEGGAVNVQTSPDYKDRVQAPCASSEDQFRRRIVTGKMR